MRIETQKQTLAAREESIKKLMEMLQNKGMSMYTLCISLIFFESSFCSNYYFQTFYNYIYYFFKILLLLNSDMLEKIKCQKRPVLLYPMFR